MVIVAEELSDNVYLEGMVGRVWGGAGTKYLVYVYHR